MTGNFPKEGAVRLFAIASAVLLPVTLLAAAPATAKADRGSLRVIAQGVPAGNAAKITVARKGFKKKVSSGGRLRNLAPGTYRVWASPIVVDDGTAAVPNLPIKVKVKKRARSTLQVGYLWTPRVDFYPPSPAQSLKVTSRSANHIQLGWKNGSAPDLDFVAVRRKSGRVAPKTLDEGKVVPVGQLRGTSVRDSDLRAGMTYSYSVFMVDAAGNASGAVSVTTRTIGRTDMLASGVSHTCAVVSDPSNSTPKPEDNQIACWGADDYGQLGDGGGADSSLPLHVDVPSPVKVAAGGNHACALTDEGDLWCWGRNDHGQLGTGSATQSEAPVRVQIDRVQDVAAGSNHTCAVLQSGSVRCWGANETGQSGATPSRRELSPVTVAQGGEAVQVTAGHSHSCLLLKSGAVRCWGADDRGQLGNGADSESFLPVPVGLVDVQSITAGVNHTCADVDNDQVECWGANKYGQLGDNTTIDRNTPVQTALDDAEGISAGAYHTCAIAGDRAKCWGRNNSGRLGDGTTVDRRLPVTVAGLDSVSLVSAGGYHSCAVAEGTTRCWGANGHGQLGNLTQTGSVTPVDVDGL